MAQYLDLEGAKVIVNKIKEGDNRTYIKTFDYVEPKDGYINIALITITQEFQDSPIEFKIIQRRAFGSIIVKFKNMKTKDPEIDYFKKIGDNIKAYIIRKSEGLWELYVEKNEFYDYIEIVDFYKGNHVNGINIEWDGKFIESLPSGSLEAKLMEMDTAGNSATATKLATARTIALSGSVTGSGSFDGSGNLSIATTTNHTHTKSQITDMPTSLKNPTALTVQFNGTTNKTYDGSSAQTVNITPSGIGAYTKGEVDNKVTSLNNNISQLSNPNLLINGDFQIWQRGTSFNCNENITYTTDRWALSGDTLPTIKKTEKGLVLANGKVGTWTNFYYKSEDDFFDRLIGKKVTLTFKTSSSTNDVGLVWCRGTTIDNKKEFLYHEEAYFSDKTTDTFSITFDIKQKTTKNEFGIQLKSDNIKRTIELLWAKLEIGGIATPFVPRIYAEELNDCQRYYQTYVASGVANTPRVLGMSSRYPTIMRVKPTLTFKDNIIHEHGKGTVGNNTLIDDFSVLEDRIDYMAIKTKDMFTVGKIYNVQGICLDAEIY